MKSRLLRCVIAMTLFGLMAITGQLAAQQQGAGPQPKKEHPRYKLLDIGTFGGSESNVNPAVNGGPTISRRGTTVGTSATSIPSPPTSVACGGLDGTVPFVFHGFKWKNGVVADLGALPPAVDNCSNAEAINARGEIIGTSENGVTDPVTGTIEVHAVLWKDGEIKDLGTLGGTSSSAGQINNRGQVAGFAFNAFPDPFTPTGTQIRAFLWENGQMNDLGTLGGPDSFGGSINERGQVAGWSFVDSTPNPTTGLPTEDLFLWEEGRMVDLGNLGGGIAGPTGLNNRGQVIGIANLAGDQFADPFLWDGERLIDLFTDTVGGNPVSANAINDAGEVVGQALFSNQFFHAYVRRKNGVATDLGTLPGDCFSEAFANNARGQVVGQSFSCDFSSGSVFLWENGSMIDLDTFVPPGSGLKLAEAQAINDRGEIAGDLLPAGCTDDTQCGHAFVLIHCDDDHSHD